MGHHRGRVQPWNVTWLLVIGWVISYANEWEGYSSFFWKGVEISRIWATTHSLVFFFFFSFFFISWKLITLQYCSGFCHTLTWISHGFTCVPYPDPLSSLPPHPIPLGLPSAPALSTCLMHPTWAGDRFTLDTILVSMLFSQNIPPSPSPRVPKSVLYICVSFSVLHIGLSLASF